MSAVRKLFSLTWWAVIGLLLTGCPDKETHGKDADSKAPTSLGARYLYVVDCDGRVDKLDTEARRKVASFHLSDKSGSPPAVATAPDGKMDGCLAARVLPDASGQQVSLIAPKTARQDSEGLQEFQRLTFSLPDWKLVAAVPAGKLPEAPQLQRDASAPQGVRVLRDDQWMPVTYLDLQEYAGKSADIDGIIVESSSGVSLLSLLDAPQSKQLALGLANTVTRKLTKLNDLPPTTLHHVHLAPGGGYVLVEVVNNAGNGVVTRTGALRLYDDSGKVAVGLTDERLGKPGSTLGFIALTGNGDAVYGEGGDYYFVALGRAFPNPASAAVTAPIPDPVAPGVVFAAQ
ncbi:MAG: hypothetical protein IT523_02200 [Burkholderiales bacterium]|nr:hypothetical protein [Burkholderiales bacterium]